MSNANDVETSVKIFMIDIVNSVPFGFHSLSAVGSTGNIVYRFAKDAKGIHELGEIEFNEYIQALCDSIASKPYFSVSLSSYVDKTHLIEIRGWGFKEGKYFALPAKELEDAATNGQSVPKTEQTRFRDSW